MMKKNIYRTLLHTSLFISCFSVAIILPTQLTSCSGSNVQYIAHRGAPAGDNTYSTRHFENNHESFIHGGEQTKFMGLETDVYRTRDGKWVVVHDDNPFMDSATGVRQSGTYVNDKDFTFCMGTQIIPSANYPSWVRGGGHYLDSFDTYLRICKEYGKFAIIEIKEPYHLSTMYPPRGDKGYLLDSENYLVDLWQQVINSGMENQCFIISFQECYIRWFKQNHSELSEKHRLQQLCDWYPNLTNDGSNTDYKTLIDNGFDVSAGDPNTAWVNRNNYIDITKDMINYAHSKGQKFGVWTIDVKDIADRYIKWGVDFITTDCYKFLNSKNDIPQSYL